MIDPRLRQRVEVVPVRTSVKADVTNEELVSSFLRAIDGKVAATTRATYGFSIRDAMRYFRTPEGAEVPVRSWSKQEVWAYFHFIEANYCASFASAHFKPGESEGERDPRERVEFHETVPVRAQISVPLQSPLRPSVHATTMRPPETSISM